MFKIRNLCGITLSRKLIENYIPKAEGTFVKVYLYGYMLAATNEEKADNKNIAKALDMLETDVIKAWRYWEDVGVVNIVSGTDAQEGRVERIEFLDVNVAREVHKPTYGTGELSAAMEQNMEIKSMYHHAEDILGKTLSTVDIATLYGFYDWLKLPVQVILMLLEYCVEDGKKNMRYIEKVAISWADAEVNTIAKASEYLLPQRPRKRPPISGAADTSGYTKPTYSDGTAKPVPAKSTTKTSAKKSAKHLNYTQSGNYDMDELERLAATVDRN